MMVLPSFTTTAPSVHFTYPPASLFNFSPSSNPAALSPPSSDRSFSRPFNINQELYSNALHPAVPLTIAIVYATTVTYVNRLNKQRNHKPWAFSNSIAFYFLLVAHNVFLSLYSAWTFLGMLNAITKSWPGWDGQYGLAGVADALCKMNGPRGLGSAATYNTGLSEWSYADKAIKLLGGRPDSTDVGRIWNEGLAFYGWLFYLSKFYEVVDTAIVLAKGKETSFLQTFHHTGAMMSLWAGIRYMSPPIWMFVFINSGIHAVMYTYYTLAALTVQVPTSMKRILTSFQIVQIIFGTSYALAHLFVAYDIPIEMPYLYVRNLSTALPSGASTVSSAISSAFASATAVAGFTHWLKKAALRAAGEEGLAENVRNYQGETFGVDAVRAADIEKTHEEIRYRSGIQRVHCLDTSGEVFAILLNAVYLIPLAYLFFRFFYKSYMSRSQGEPPKPTKGENIKDSAVDAEKKLEQEIKDAIANEQGGTTEPPPELKEKWQKAKSDAKQTAFDVKDKAKSEASELGAQAQKTANDLGNKVKDATSGLPEKAQKGAQELGHKAKDAAGDLPAKAQQGAQNLGSKVKDASGDIPATAQDLGAQAKKTGKDMSQAVQDDLRALQEKVKKLGGDSSKIKGGQEDLQALQDKVKKLGGDISKGVQDDLQALQEKIKKLRADSSKGNQDDSPDLQDKAKKMSGDSLKSKAGNENSKPDGDTNNRDKSPEKRPKSREKSPEKKALIHGENSSSKAPTPRDKSPVKSSTPREKSPVKPSKPAQEPKKESADTAGPETKTESEEKKSSSPDLGASGYEMVPDEPKTDEERKAEAEMQPAQS